MVAVDEPKASALRERATDGGFSSAHEADEINARHLQSGCFRSRPSHRYTSTC
jgi:hypothetical protein